MHSGRADIIERLPDDLGMLLRRLGKDLRSLYGERYRGLVLYGSYARGEADEGSDVDLLLLLEGEVDTAREIMLAQEVEWPIFMETKYVISLFPINAQKYGRSEQPFLSNARREGIALDGY